MQSFNKLSLQLLFRRNHLKVLRGVPLATGTVTGGIPEALTIYIKPTGRNSVGKTEATLLAGYRIVQN